MGRECQRTTSGKSLGRDKCEVQCLMEFFPENFDACGCDVSPSNQARQIGVPSETWPGPLYHLVSDGDFELGFWNRVGNNLKDLDPGAVVGGVIFVRIKKQPGIMAKQVFKLRQTFRT